MRKKQFHLFLYALRSLQKTIDENESVNTEDLTSDPSARDKEDNFQQMDTS
ncbi:hypothetical protein D915_002102 [Fasciola hepatica]|uniref:Uncharacterized protein n=1 Tax=Fasciola hepatica TaxID=6192 RepID=A0A2H1CRT8_FASHE|nr:hypothetical protein D915_002102 [Fasciola hepatica]